MSFTLRPFASAALLLSMAGLCAGTLLAAEQTEPSEASAVRARPLVLGVVETAEPSFDDNTVRPVLKAMQSAAPGTQIDVVRLSSATFEVAVAQLKPDLVISPAADFLRIVDSIGAHPIGTRKTKYAKHPSKSAGGAVIIAAGGFTANRAMIAAFRPDIDPQTPTTANPRGELLDGSTGDGILMAQAAGAKLVDMSAVEVVPFTGGRLTDFVGGDVWLNAEGRRFVSEGETFDVIRSAVEAQPEGRLWVVSDVKSNKGATLPVKLMSGTVASAESLEALAKALQVPFTTLRASIDRWNQSVKSGWDQDFNRPMPAQAQTIDTPPFYYGEERFSIHYTSGGIAISPKAQVLDRDDHPIPGLYAAGETTGGVHGRTRLGGCALTDCFVFGRIAGKEAALRSQKSLRPR